jgi:aldose 1-epimerase
VTPDGQPVEIFTLTRDGAPTVKITNWGGFIVAILAPDRSGAVADVTLGYDTLDGYLADEAYLGCLVGRFANRIANATFTLDGRQYDLPKNEGPNSLHGGVRGFSRRLWSARVVESGDGDALDLRYQSADGEEGYPGTLTASVVHSLRGDGSLCLKYSAVTDAPTVVNLTSHVYWNLAGDGAGTIHDHLLQVEADTFTPVDVTLIPTGEIRAVEGTPMDFRRPASIGSRIDGGDAQTTFASGYDHNFVLRGASGTLRHAARVVDEGSGRALEVQTTQPGVQLYSGNLLDGKVVGKSGRRYVRRSGFCLEPQHFPDSPNQPAFPSVVLRPGETYRETTLYRVTVDVP